MIKKRQKQVLDFITSYTKKHGFAPSLEEIKTHLGLSSVSTAHYHVKNLEKTGLIYKEDNQPRAVTARKELKSIEIPVLGVIAAGQPIETIEIHNESISLSQSEIPSYGKHYALKVSGSSMIEDGIFDGDIVVIREQNTADNGQTVVAIIDDNQATLKKIYREKNRFRLQPANQSLLPFYRNEVEIRGVVVKIIREIEPTRHNDSKLLKIIRESPPTMNVTRVTNSIPEEKAKPFIQWVGGKREMIPQYEMYIPKKFNAYFEPFLGGGAMFFHLAPVHGVLSDNNKELVRTYEGVRDNPEEVITILKELRSRHSKELYMRIRSVDREMNIFQELSGAEIAARMIYLNQTCFNGLYRVNQLGQFNVPIGSSLNRLICDEHTIRNASKILAKVDIREDGFETVLKDAKSGDFVYLDPPYYPISNYSDFTRYTKEKFHKEDQIRLKNEFSRLDKIGCKVMLSNSDCEFIKDLFKEYRQHKVYSGRTLNCKKDKRGKVSELFITNY
jgi:DNA adenine methylase